jgi:hypothetical protein
MIRGRGNIAPNRLQQTMHQFEKYRAITSNALVELVNWFSDLLSYISASYSRILTDVVYLTFSHMASSHKHS